MFQIDQIYQDTAIKPVALAARIGNTSPAARVHFLLDGLLSPQEAGDRRGRSGRCPQLGLRRAACS